MKDYAFNIFNSKNIAVVAFECIQTKEVHVFEMSPSRNRFKDLESFFKNIDPSDRFIGYGDAEAKFKLLDHAVDTMSMALVNVNAPDILNSYFNSLKTRSQLSREPSRKNVVLDMEAIINGDNVGDDYTIQAVAMALKEKIILPEIPTTDGFVMGTNTTAVVPYTRFSLMWIRSMFFAAKDKVNKRYALSRICGVSLMGLRDSEAKELFLLEMLKHEDEFSYESLASYAVSTKKDVPFELNEVLPSKTTDSRSRHIFMIPEFDKPFERYAINSSTSLSHGISVVYDKMSYLYDRYGISAYRGPGSYPHNKEDVIVKVDLSRIKEEVALTCRLFPAGVVREMTAVSKTINTMKSKALHSSNESNNNTIVFDALDELLPYLVDSYSDKSSSFYSYKAGIHVDMYFKTIVTDLISDINLNCNPRIIQLDDDKLVCSMSADVLLYMESIVDAYDREYGINLNYSLFENWFTTSPNDYMATIFNDDLTIKRDERSFIQVETSGILFRMENKIGERVNASVIGKALYEALVYGNMPEESIPDHTEYDDFCFHGTAYNGSELRHGKRSVPNGIKYFYSGANHILMQRNASGTEVPLTTGKGVAQCRGRLDELPTSLTLRPYIAKVNKVIELLSNEQLDLFDENSRN